MLPKLFYSEPSISNNAAHGKSIYGIVAWNSYDSISVGHHNVFAPAYYAESSFFDGPDCIEVIDARILGTVRPLR